MGPGVFLSNIFSLNLGFSDFLWLRVCRLDGVDIATSGEARCSSSVNEEQRMRVFEHFAPDVEDKSGVPGDYHVFEEIQDFYSHITRDGSLLLPCSRILEERSRGLYGNSFGNP